jgi:hypothetical protein
MIENTIAELEARIGRAEVIKPDHKTELLQLLSKLRSEIGALPEAQGEQAQSIARFTSVSAQEAMRQKRDPELVELSLQGLSSSVKQFQQSHPALVGIVNRICETLANLGI